MKNDINFKIGDYCIYNTHGVAKIIDIKNVEILDIKSKCLILFIEREKIHISVPCSQVDAGGIRKVCSKAEMEKVFSVLSVGVKKLKGMWNRRAKEYEEKINSGNILQLAEVIKDLTRDIEESERAFSERMIYETALYRLSSELAILENISINEAQIKIIETAQQRVKFEAMEKCDKIKNA
jgi:CarD family transcriptional regulator